MTYPLLKDAPPHDSEAFIAYLGENNVVVDENDAWILIENCKYHTKEKPFLTLFAKQSVNTEQWEDLRGWLSDYLDWEWLKKSSERQTVKRFHIHIYQTDPKTGEDKQR